MQQVLHESASCISVGTGTHNRADFLLHTSSLTVPLEVVSGLAGGCMSSPLHGTSVLMFPEGHQYQLPIAFDIFPPFGKLEIYSQRQQKVLHEQFSNTPAVSASTGTMTNASE